MVDQSQALMDPWVNGCVFKAHRFPKGQGQSQVVKGIMISFKEKSWKESNISLLSFLRSSFHLAVFKEPRGYMGANTLVPL